MCRDPQRRWSEGGGEGAIWMHCSQDVHSNVVYLLFFPDFFNGMRRILVQDNMAMSPSRRALTVAAGLFIDS
jgi:hypothetical protein